MIRSCPPLQAANARYSVRAQLTAAQKGDEWQGKRADDRSFRPDTGTIANSCTSWTPVLRRFFRSYWTFDPLTRSQVDRLRTAAAKAAGDADISALERRGVLTGFLDDLASIEAVLPLVDEALRGGIAGDNPGYGRAMGISYLQALNLLRTMRDDPSNYVPRSFQVPPAPALRAPHPAPRFKRKSASGRPGATRRKPWTPRRSRTCRRRCR